MAFDVAVELLSRNVRPMRMVDAGHAAVPLWRNTALRDGNAEQRNKAYAAHSAADNKLFLSYLCS